MDLIQEVEVKRTVVVVAEDDDDDDDDNRFHDAISPQTGTISPLNVQLT